MVFENGTTLDGEEAFEVCTLVIPNTIENDLSFVVSDIQKSPSAAVDATSPAAFVHDFVIVDAFAKSFAYVGVTVNLSEILIP